MKKLLIVLALSVITNFALAADWIKLYEDDRFGITISVQRTNINRNSDIRTVWEKWEELRAAYTASSFKNKFDVRLAKRIYDCKNLMIYDLADYYYLDYKNTKQLVETSTFSPPYPNDVMPDTPIEKVFNFVCK